LWKEWAGLGWENNRNSGGPKEVVVNGWSIVGGAREYEEWELFGNTCHRDVNNRKGEKRRGKISRTVLRQSLTLGKEGEEGIFVQKDGSKKCIR